MDKVSKQLASEPTETLQSPVWLYRLCCIALTVTAMTFAIRAGILQQLSGQYSLSDSELGWINAMAFLGFPLATLTGGALYNWLGAKRLLMAAFVGHLLGLGLTISAEGFWSLLVSTFFIGLANGAVEAGANPLIATLYPQQKTKMLNRFHMWFPGGIFIGAIVSQSINHYGGSWQIQIASMLLPTLVYGVMLWLIPASRFKLKQTQLVLTANTSSNFKQLMSPLFLLLLLCMTLTATTELGTQQWIDRILGASGASPMSALALMTVIMMSGRYYCGALSDKVGIVGVLFGSSILACCGLVALSHATGWTVYAATVIFALGVTCFWPTMLAAVAHYFPQTGALGLSVMGGVGMFAVSIWQPVIGRLIDNANAQAQAIQLNGEAAQLYAGQLVLSYLAILPLLLIVCFWFLLVKLENSRAAGLFKFNGGRP